MSTLLLILAALSLLAVLVAYRNRRMNQLMSRIPGPSLFVPLFGNTLEVLVRMVAFKKDVVEVNAILREKYGSVYRVWVGYLPYILISNADDTEVVLTHPAVADKGLGYQLIEPWLGDGLLLAGGEKWARRRKMIAPAFSPRILEQFVEVFDKQATILEQKLRGMVDRPPFDIVPFLTLCTLDVICETAMGVPIHAQTQNSDYVKAVKTACDCFFKRQLFPWLYYDIALRFSTVGWQFYRAIKVLQGLTHKVIRERKNEITKEIAASVENEDDAGVKQKAVLLDHLLTKSLRGEGITDKDITDEVSTFMFAGHDTSMTSLGFTLHLLSMHPEVQEAVWMEVRDVLGDDDKVTGQHLQDLKYLECVVKESLRLYPSVPAIARHCSQEFRLPSGYVVPAGAQVIVNLVQLHRDQDTFEEPERFNPDRFLAGTPAKHPFAYIPFSNAQRNCIGQRYAMMEMKAILARLVRSFRILPPKEDYRFKLGCKIVLVAEGGVQVQLQHRTS